MKKDKIKKLIKGESKVMHKHLGVCLVKDIIYSYTELFGIVLTPLTQEGLALLHNWSGTKIDDMLEGSYRLISEVIE